MKIIFMGTPDFATYIVDSLYNAGHEIVLIVTQPDKPRGRSGKLTPSPVKKWATEHDVKVFQPSKIRDEESVAYLSGIDADIAVVAAFGQILPESVLSIPRLGCVNVHASLLPKYRGAAPIQCAILNGDDKTGVTIMQMGVGLDDGDILLTKEIELGGTETGGELFDELANLGGEAIVEALDKLQAGEITPIPQDESKATHVCMICKEDGLIDWNKSALSIERCVRGLNPWPTAYTSYNGKNLKIWKSHVVSADEFAINKLEANVAEVCYVDKRNLYVMTGDGVLGLDEIQLEGKKRMEVQAFLLGNQIHPGEKLG